MTGSDCMYAAKDHRKGRRVHQRKPRRAYVNGDCKANVSSVAAHNVSDKQEWPPMETKPSIESLRSHEVQMPVESHQAADCIEALAKDAEWCNSIVEQLDNASPDDKHSLILRLAKSSRLLSVSKAGCHVVQKMFEVAQGPDRDLIIMELAEHVIELYQSIHGNHVLSKAIEVLPAAKNSFIISALLGRGVVVSKNRYGCRIVCRLIEHCGEELIGDMLTEIVSQAHALAWHNFGTFVVQTAFEHLSFDRRQEMLSRLLPSFSALCMHRNGSLVAQRVLDYCEDTNQDSAMRALIMGELGATLVDVAGGRYGSYVVEQCAGMKHACRQEMRQILSSNLWQLQSLEHAERVINAFGLAQVEVKAASMA